ncbi:hypothetical protein [Aequorivita echinoideorum]|uniref:tRNA (Guanine-N1)-methyltransferase n=1 Tax=Aequorivita echinoideorum TaxID=1549647 RepID=A0ABS5S4K8_9FLAO|nr:hypothetical protein [Aequorivita echinoideorum]MBT0608162.1 hypothetical protein [Aequorivita echinoideorum]
MKKILIVVLPLLFMNWNISAQDSIQIRKNTLNEQMIDAFEKSNSYQEYKVIKKSQLNSLRKNISDSISAYEKEISQQKVELGIQNTIIDSLKQNLKITKENLDVSKEKEDGIYFLGILTSKTTYNTIMWSIILILLLAGGFLFYRFINSAKITNATELKMAELEIELEDYRRNSLEREQKLRRKLQDEINKNRKL